jgi:PAS domain S-box-containing protein
LYEDPQPYRYPQPAPEWSRLVLAYDEENPAGSSWVELEPGGRRFPSRQLVPEGILPQQGPYNLIVHALYFQNKQIGVVLFDGNQREGDVYDMLRAQISSALQGALLVRQTQAHRAELARERDLLHTLMNSSPDYLFFKDRESRFIRTNRAHAQRLLGLPGPAAAVGKTDFDLFPKEEAQRFFDEEQRIMETGQPVVAREWSLHSRTTGKVVWLSEHKVPIRDAAGHVVGLVGVSRDVTAQKQAEAALAREKYIVDTFLANIPDSIYFKDRKSRIIRSNQAHARAFGLTDPGELMGKSDFDLFPEDTARHYPNRTPTPESRRTRCGRALGLDHENAAARRAWRDHWDVRHFPGYYATQSYRGGLAGGKRHGRRSPTGGRISEPRQKRVSGQHESRTPDAPQRDSRLRANPQARSGSPPAPAGSC